MRAFAKLRWTLFITVTVSSHFLVAGYQHMFNEHS